VVTLSDGPAAGRGLRLDPRLEREVAGEIEGVVIVRPEVLSHAVEGEAATVLPTRIRRSNAPDAVIGEGGLVGGD